jgi:predicted double-glycine peptidase
MTAIPSIEFEYEIKRHAIDEIEEELDELNKQPMIAWVTLMKGRKAAHAVVVTGLENRIVYFNDPIYGKQEEDLATFLTRWEDQDRTLIKVKIGKKRQKMLEEFEQTRDSGTRSIGV